jgi:translation initiation factor 3 subunit I
LDFSYHVVYTTTSVTTDDSERLITASADSSVRLWRVQTGEELYKFAYKEPCRAVSFSVGEELAAVTTDAFMGASSTIHIIPISRDLNQQQGEDIMKITVDREKISRVFFHDMNRQLVTAHENGTVRRWDVETGKLLQTESVHEKSINDLRWSQDGTHFITASTDKSAKLVDADTFEIIKVYQTERPVNSADINPIFNHIVLGGGQDASQVTTTSSRAGKFESKFFHKLYEEEFGSVRGHFGPINTVAFHPDGRSFTTGGEDGYVRLHHLDRDYMVIGDNIHK